jgi:ankyrin repeat protein
MNNLHRAARQNNLYRVYQLLEEGKNVNAQDKDGHTALYNAASRGLNTIVSTLVESNASINLGDKYGVTPLHKAVNGGHLETVITLIWGGAYVNSKDSVGNTPLHNASYRGYNNIVKVLLKKGAYVDSKDTSDRTPIHFASVKGHLDVVKTLIRAGANVNIKDSTGSTPLHYSVTSYDKPGVTRALIRAGSKIDSRDCDGYTPLLTALKKNHCHIKSALVLIKAGSDLKKRTDNGESALHLATQCNSLRIVNILIKAGASLENRNRFGSTPLHIAVSDASFSTSKPIINALIKAGASLNSSDKKGSTPLHLASSGYFPDIRIIKKLLVSGANPYLRNIKGKTPADVVYINYSAKEKSDKIRNMLQQWKRRERQSLAMKVLGNRVPPNVGRRILAESGLAYTPSVNKRPRRTVQKRSRPTTTPRTGREPPAKRQRR